MEGGGGGVHGGGGGGITEELGLAPMHSVPSFALFSLSLSMRLAMEMLDHCCSANDMIPPLSDILSFL